VLSPDLGEITGAQELQDWFGYWPDFHDAEILEVHLQRTGQSSVKIHTWQMTDKVDEKGCYEAVKHVTVEFLLENVAGMNLEGFNHQNVISELCVRKVPSGYILDFRPCFGFAGTIETAKLSLRITAGKPA
jgi:hypothetical protein